MILIREYRDESRVSKYDRKRAIIACERCHEENDVRFTYATACIKNNKKYCISCKKKINTEEFMREHNNQEPLSRCLTLVYDGDKVNGEFECSKCGSIRTRRHNSKSYSQLCRKCSIAGMGQKHEVRHDTRLARIYGNMKDRCYNKNQDSYKYYGGKGVTICQEWLDDRTKFYDWALANGYTDLMEIDKDKLCMEQGIAPAIYSPTTCIWMTRDENRMFMGTRTGTIAKGISKYAEDKYRVRLTHAFPKAKDGYYKTLDLAIKARGPERSGASA